MRQQLPNDQCDGAVVVLSRIGVRLSVELARSKGLSRSGHVLDSRGRPIRKAGFDPRLQRPVEIAGWIEPSAVDGQWTIKLHVAVRSVMALAITSGQGNVVKTLAEGRLAPGEHEFSWSSDDLGSGRYFLRLVSGDMVQKTKLLDK